MQKLKRIKLVRLRSVVVWINKFSLRFQGTFVRLTLDETGSALTVKILWSVLSNYKLRSALINIESLVSI